MQVRHRYNCHKRSRIKGALSDWYAKSTPLGFNFAPAGSHALDFLCSHMQLTAPRSLIRLSSHVALLLLKVHARRRMILHVSIAHWIHYCLSVVVTRGAHTHESEFCCCEGTTATKSFLVLLRV